MEAARVSDREKLFTLAQITAALGLHHKQQVVRRLENTSATGRIPVRGKAVDAWSVTALPAALHAELETLRRRHHYRSIAALIEKPPALYRHPFKPDLLTVTAARRWMEILTPLLRQRGREPLAALARKARETFSALRITATPSISAIEARMREALRRDAGWERFDREELYYDLHQRAEIPVSAPAAAATTQALLDETVDELTRWQMAFDEWDACGKSPVARKRIIAGLSLPGMPLAGLSADAMRMRWNRNLTLRERHGDNRKALSSTRSECGRKAKFQLGEDEIKAARLLRLTKGSVALAVPQFADDPACLPATRAMIIAEMDRAAQRKRAPFWPESLRRAFHVTAEEEALFRGPKHFQSVEFCARRGMEWINEAGHRLPMLPNTVFESDDMSSNEPFTWLEPDENGELVRRIGRQTLCTLDVFSCNWLGVSPIGRARDAYRVEDIAEHMLDCVNTHGLPRVWRLEKGVWENNFLDGIKISTNADGSEVRWGGLGDLFTIVRAWTSRQKGTVEVSFNLLQDLLAHSSTSIGRQRGEFEKGTKLLMAASAGDAEAWGRFWEIDKCADAFARAMFEFNHRPKKRRAFGRDLVVPADLYREAVKRELPPEEAWRFCPVKAMATIRSGHVEKVVPHYPLPFRFRVNGGADGLYLEHGHKALVAFHPGHPERGCHIFNAETGSRNRDGLGFGELIAIAPMSDDAPQVDLSPGARSLVARKNANAAVRSEFRGIVRIGAPVVSSGTVRTGFGESAKRESHPKTNARQGQEENGDRGSELTAAARRLRVSKTPTFDEAAELARIAQLEAEAHERGDLLGIQ